MPDFSLEFLIGSALAIITFGFGLGVTLAMDSKTKGEFRFAAACFLVCSGIALYGIGAWEMSAAWTNGPRRIVAYGLFAFVAVVTVESIRWAHTRHLRAAQGTAKENRRLEPPPNNSPVKPSSPPPPNAQPMSKAEPRDKPIPKQLFEDPGIRQNMALQLSELSREILNFARGREKEEQALPALDPSVPEGKTNIPWVKLHGYHIKTQTAFKFGPGHYEMRCRELMSALSNRADLADDVKLVKNWCQGLPQDGTALKSLSAYLAKLAEKVQEPPN
jgi:hypothetical protein